MKKLLLALCVLSTSAFADVYLTISGAKVQKAKIAVGQVHPSVSAQFNNPQLARDIRAVMMSDLQLMDLFDFVDPAAHANLDTPEDFSSPNYDRWAPVGARFLLLSTYALKDGQLVLDTSFHDVSGKKKIFGTRYQFTANQYTRLVHTLSEDILKALTGEKGLFLSRIAMVCQSKQRKRNLPKEVYLVEPDGRNFIKLTNDNTISVTPSWSPDGKNLSYTQYEWIYARGKRWKGTVLKRHYLDTGKRVPISAREGMNSGGAWSPDGKKIASTLSFTGRPEIYLIELANPNSPQPLSRNIKWEKIGGGFQNANVNLLFEVEPSWSPDGQKMVISSARNRHPMIYVVDMNTYVAKQLTFAGIYNASPAWSPKGDKIMFAAQRLEEGNFDLFLIDPDGNNLQRVTVGDRPGRKVNSENPSWAATGRHLVYASNDDGAYAIYLTNIDQTIKRRISPPGLSCTNPSWSPPEN
jgi:TolB protein